MQNIHQNKAEFWVIYGRVKAKKCFLVFCPRRTNNLSPIWQGTPLSPPPSHAPSALQAKGYYRKSRIPEAMNESHHSVNNVTNFYLTTVQHLPKNFVNVDDDDDHGLGRFECLFCTQFCCWYQSRHLASVNLYFFERCRCRRKLER